MLKSGFFKVMKNIMIKSIGALALLSIIILACSNHGLNFNNSTYKTSSVDSYFGPDGYWRTKDFVARRNPDNTLSLYGANSLYGAYLAGRVAHMRQDFDAASEYYKIVGDKDSSNQLINRTIYVILSSLGQIDKAVPYAEKELKAGNESTLAPLILAIKDFNDGQYESAKKHIDSLTDKIHTSLIDPLFSAWIYAGLKDEAKAVALIDAITKDPALDTLKLFHKGMIYDYLGNPQQAALQFEDIIKKYPQNVTYRILEVITDFYVRNGDKDMARRISNHYNDRGLLAILLKDIERKIDAGNKNSKPVIDTPQKGLAEALFNIGTMFRSSPGGTEFAQIYIAASSFLNPQYEVSKIALANILEEVGLLKEANRYYEQIGRDSASYFIARIKMIENYNKLEDFAAAEKQLKLLLQDYPQNTQLLTDLGNINSDLKRDAQAIKLYKKALKSMKTIKSDSWPIYYALAVSYNRLNELQNADEALQKALELSNRDANVLNYLGYSWLDRNKNIEAAAEMILEAYQKYPYDGHILDSLGWLYYRIGDYKKAVAYLEQASALNPGNAIINEHLGDAYWFGGRRNEAVFQWKHALDLKEDSDYINRAVVTEKIESGTVENLPLTIENPQILEVLNSLNPDY